MKSEESPSLNREGKSGSSKKNFILAMLVILGVVTFLDRINISVAGSSIMKDLNLSAAEWGWVQSAFILSYGLMQIPMGAYGDRHGHRKVLTEIVLWWSLFTAFTGVAGGLVSLLIIRFMFGVGEAGSSPCSTGVISRWFEKHEVGKAQGYVWAASRMGGALTPFVVIPVMAWLGWRAAFWLLGGLGVIWAVVWYIMYRDKTPFNSPEGRAAGSLPSGRYGGLAGTKFFATASSGPFAPCISSMPSGHGSSSVGSPRSWS